MAETRRQALEEALTENQGLCQKVEELEKENEILEEMLKHAKDMVEMLSVRFIIFLYHLEYIGLEDIISSYCFLAAHL